jgi:hypothetical protein
MGNKNISPNLFSLLHASPAQQQQQQQRRFFSLSAAAAAVRECE